MNNREIIEKLATERVVETMINKITRNKSVPDPSTLDDLAADVYLWLLEDEKFPKIYEEGHANFYISRILMNNIASSSSPYYRNYIRTRAKSCELNEGIGNGDDTTEDNW